MKKQMFKTIVAVLSLNLLLHFSSFAQDGKITVTVNDVNGNPIEGAVITVGEEESLSVTDEKGQFSITVIARTPVLIEAEGYESLLSYAMPPPIGMGSVMLIKMPYLMGEKDRVNVPFGTLKNRQLTGAVTQIDPKEILKYDQQGGFAGALNGRIPGMFGANSIRGKSDPMIIVDGVPRSASEINLQQIDKITVLRDLSTTMMYGSQANNGVILVTTKRGELLKNYMRVTAENGYNMPVSYPNYLSAGEYMGLYNTALINDGLDPLFSDDAIAKTISGSSPAVYPDEDFYTSTYLRDWSNSYKIVAESGGGNEVAKYYVNLGWNRNTGLLNLGEGKNEKQDRLNVRGNIDYKLSDNLSIKFDASFLVDIEESPRYTGDDFWGLASTLKPNYSPVLIPVDLVLDTDLLSNAKLIDNKYILGGNSLYTNNPYGELTSNGSSNSINRLMQINTAIDYDLNNLMEGLSATGYLALDIYNGFNERLNNTYAIYAPVFTAGDSVLTAAKIGQDVKQTDKAISSLNFYRRVGFYGALNYHRVLNSIHEVNANAIAYNNIYGMENVLQPVKHLHFGLRANYTYANKYIAELTGTVAGSSKLYESSPYVFSPAIGLGWVVSEESFLQDNSLIDYLKLRVNYAVNHSDENIDYFLYFSNYYRPGGTWEFNKGQNSNQARTAFMGNTSLSWEKNTEFNLGFETEMLNNKLRIEGAYFYSLSSDLISLRSNFYPAYYSASIYDNFGEEQYQGVELGISYTESFGDLQVSLGTNFVYSVPKTLKIDELNYTEEFDYLKETGKPTDAIFGYVALGLFRDSADILASPVQTFGSVRPGDIKYADLNGDFIIDNLDVKMIGNAQSRLGYGIHIDLKYKAFNLFALGTGQTGSDVFYRNEYYWVFGDRKYSEVVRDAWTPATAESAKYPRLSTIESNNNFRNSTYWLENQDWFRLQTVQLTWTLPANIGGMDESRIFIRGNNLATFSKVKDKMDLNIASAPRLRQFSFGLTATF